jgi:hypothetical protein
MLNRDNKPLDTKSWNFDEDVSEFSDYYSKRNSKWDHKNWDKSSSIFKKEKKKIRKAKERQAMKKEDYDNIPFFHKENDWDWN